MPEKISVNNIPALLWSGGNRRAFLYVHGKCGCKEYAAGFAGLALEAGFDAAAIDLPGHGERAQEAERFVPWCAAPEIADVFQRLARQYDAVYLRADSIGAWFSMQSGICPAASLLVSPLIDMRALICSMMRAAGVSAQRLMEEKQIVTAEGETLSWEYYNYAITHEITSLWANTSILYADGDFMTPRADIEDFARRFGCPLTVMERGEHWFHTPPQLEFLNSWTKNALAALR